MLLLGDFNARTGTYDDFTSSDCSGFIQNDLSVQTENMPQRRNFDNAINKHGKWLLELCRSLDLRILNGRVKGDSFGQPTSHDRMGINAVDYAIVDQDMFK